MSALEESLRQVMAIDGDRAHVNPALTALTALQLSRLAPAVLA